LHRTTPRTEFGEEVARYAFERGVPYTVVAKEADVPYESLRSAMYGRAPGTALVRTVRDYMTTHPVAS
jgi:hypothetical protein